ncbi:MAG: ATP synthase subunit I [Thiohalocapsa sp.]
MFDLFGNAIERQPVPTDLQWRSVHPERPAPWLLGSLLMRISLVLVGLYLVSGGYWQRLLACLAGVVGARFLVLRLTAPAVDHQPVATEARYAPESR